MSAAGRLIEVGAVADVRIEISENAPDDLFSRMQDPEIAGALYGLMDEEQVLEHWASNAVRNGVDDVSQLDGWADIDRDIVQLDVVGAYDFQIIGGPS